MAKNYGFKAPTKLLSTDETMVLWRKLQMKYSVEIETLAKQQAIETELFGAVTTRTQEALQELCARIIAENTEIN